MTETAQLLTASRAAHQQAKGTYRSGNRGNAMELFTVALEKRLAARSSDPERLDPAWLEDALAPPRTGVVGAQYHRVPGLTRAAVAAQRDADVERYFREQLGEVAPTIVTSADPEIVTPKQWREIKAGATDPDTGHTVCREGHRLQLISFDQRVCQGCGRTDELFEAKALKDTEAFQQRQKELGR